ncbi:MFS transporter [Streptomyces sp. BK022]|uniref:MFS transporter n=1 Tax=Streptomyces sp. BK022 TaxID=2512123 RepID=UPI00102A4EA9|nr:MFS transporter [Streptomyces sp. BK022]RZU34942.1 MFS transporter [Streptomyces sp. BK022]
MKKDIRMGLPSVTSRTGRLILGRGTAALATALIPTTLTLAVIGTTGAAGDLGVVLACETLPMVLLLPVAGVAADRFPPQRIVLLADLTRCAAQGVMALLLLNHLATAPRLAVLAACTGVGVAFGMPAVRRLVANTVPPTDRLKVNSRISVINGVAQIAAPALAGTLVLTLGAGWSSLSTALLFLGSALTLGGITPATVTKATARAGSFLQEVRGGWQETRRHPWFMYSVFGHGVWHLTAGLLMSLGPLVAVKELGGDASWVIMMQVGTAGLIVGGLSAQRLPVRRPLAVGACGTALYALPLAAFALSAPLAVCVVAYLLAMTGIGVLTPLWETSLQRRIPEHALGRVGSFDALISLSCRPLGLAVAAPVAAWVGKSFLLGVAAAAVAVVNLAILAIPDVRASSPREDRRTEDAKATV